MVSVTKDDDVIDLCEKLSQWSRHWITMKKAVLSDAGSTMTSAGTGYDHDAAHLHLLGGYGSIKAFETNKKKKPSSYSQRKPYFKRLNICRLSVAGNLQAAHYKEKYFIFCVYNFYKEIKGLPLLEMRRLSSFTSTVYSQYKAAALLSAHDTCVYSVMWFLISAARQRPVFCVSGKSKPRPLVGPFYYWLLRSSATATIGW